MQSPSSECSHPFPALLDQIFPSLSPGSTLQILGATAQAPFQSINAQLHLLHVWIIYSQSFSTLMNLFQRQPWLSPVPKPMQSSQRYWRPEKFPSFISKKQQQQVELINYYKYVFYLSTCLILFYSSNAHSQLFQDWWPFNSCDILAAFYSDNTLRWSPQYSSKTVVESLINGLTYNTLSLCKEWIIRLHRWANQNTLGAFEAHFQKHLTEFTESPCFLEKLSNTRLNFSTPHLQVT